MPADNLRGIEPIIWAAAYVRALPVLAGLTVDECRRAVIGAEQAADLTIEAGRDRAQRRMVEETAPRGPRTILEDIGFLPRKQRPADPEDQGDDDLNH